MVYLSQRHVLDAVLRSWRFIAWTRGRQVEEAREGAVLVAPAEDAAGGHVGLSRLSLIEV